MIWVIASSDFTHPLKIKNSLRLRRLYGSVFLRQIF